MLQIARISRQGQARLAAAASATAATGTIGFVLSRPHQFLDSAPLATSASTPVRNSVIPSRDEQISTLLASSQNKVEFDVLVVGGGATGAGTALDAQTRGLSTVLIERGDFGNETSSRST